ncbi:unnamed protein product [Discosporangium mesarthrocarpum]
MMTKGCSEEEGKLLRSKATMEVLREIQEAGEQQHGLIQEALAALEKDMPLGFAYQEVAMPVHVFHGRADHMVPFRAVQWVGEAMPACTVSFKIGGSHALVFDTDVMDSVMEHLAQDYRVFLANRASVARDRRDGDGGSASPEQEPSTFPVHTQIFQKSGNLFVRRGMPFYQWQQRHFVLEGFRLFEFAKAGDANACRTIDLRLCRTTVLASAGVGGWAEHSSGLLFPFQVEGPGRRGILCNLGAVSVEDRRDWIETVSRASSFRVRERREDMNLLDKYLSTSRWFPKPSFMGGRVCVHEWRSAPVSFSRHLTPVPPLADHCATCAVVPWPLVN